MVIASLTSMSLVFRFLVCKSLIVNYFAFNTKYCLLQVRKTYCKARRTARVLFPPIIISLLSYLHTFPYYSVIFCIFKEKLASLWQWRVLFSSLSAQDLIERGSWFAHAHLIVDPSPPTQKLFVFHTAEVFTLMKSKHFIWVWILGMLGKVCFFFRLLDLDFFFIEIFI